MSVTQLLVQTVATLVAAPPHSAAQGSRANFYDQARTIVAEFYGQPCARMRKLDTHNWYLSGDPLLVDSPHGAPGEECHACLWPRSEHG